MSREIVKLQLTHFLEDSPKVVKIPCYIRVVPSVYNLIGLHGSLEQHRSLGCLTLERELNCEESAVAARSDRYK